MRKDVIQAGFVGHAARKGSAICGRKVFRHGRFVRGMVAAVAIPFALTSCTTTRWATAYCLTPPQYQKLKDAEPGKVGSKLDGNAQDDLKTIAGSAIELRQYDGDLLNVLGGCVEPGK